MREETGQVDEVLMDVMAGNVIEIRSLSRFSQNELRLASLARPTVLSVDALRKAIQYALGPHSDMSTLKSWASFMMRGYLSTGNERIRAIDIQFDSTSEDLISEIVSRLDEIYDPLNGVVTPEELGNFLALLDQA